MKDLSNLMLELKKWCESKNLKCSFAKRNALKSQNYFFANKNDCRIYSYDQVGNRTVDSIPHLSVWLYSNSASVVFCVEDEAIISILDSIPSIAGIEYCNKKRKHYKLSDQSDINIETSAFIANIINQSNNLYLITKEYF